MQTRYGRMLFMVKQAIRFGFYTFKINYHNTACRFSVVRIEDTTNIKFTMSYLRGGAWGEAEPCTPDLFMEAVGVLVRMQEAR